MFEDALHEGTGALEDFGLYVEDAGEDTAQVLETPALVALGLGQGHVEDDDGVGVGGDRSDESAVEL